jgi:DNA-binding beta-propeller fold protein YncE
MMHGKTRLLGTLAVLAWAIAAPAAQADGLFVANELNNTVSEVTPSGSVSTFASGFNDPFGLAVNASGDLFVANFSNNTISEVTPSGSVSTFATGFSGPFGLAFGPEITPVPAPPGLLLGMVAVLCLAGYGWRRRKLTTA